MKCLICNRGTKPNAPYCQEHQRELDRQRAEEKKKADVVKYVTYRGHVVAFYKNGGDSLRASYHGMTTNGIPKGKIINLDVWCEGFTREEIKRLKAVVLRLSRI